MRIKSKDKELNHRHFIGLRLTDVELDLLDQGAACLSISRSEYLRKNPANPYLMTTDWDWTIDPMGIRFCCREITSRYGLPIVISENGLGAFDKKTEGNQIHDEYRIHYLKEHLKELGKAIEEGCEIWAYCTWSFTDLLSWLNGYQKRYGFVYVDRDEEEGGTLNRYKKDSFYWYQDVIKTDGENLYK